MPKVLCCSVILLASGCPVPLDGGCPYDEEKVEPGSADASIAAELEAEFAGSSRWTVGYLPEEDWPLEYQDALVALGAIDLTVAVAGDAVRRVFDDAECGEPQVIVPIEVEVRSDDGSLDVSGPLELSGSTEGMAIGGGPSGELTGGVPRWATDEAHAKVGEGACPGFDPEDVAVWFEVQGPSEALELKSLYDHDPRGGGGDCGPQSGILAIAGLTPASRR